MINSERKYVNAFVERVSGVVVSALIPSVSDSDGSVKYKEIHIPLSDFSVPPLEEEPLLVYADTLRPVILNKGSKLFCRVKYCISGEKEKVSTKVFEKKLKFSGLYKDNSDYANMKKARRNFWKLCLKEKNLLERIYSGSSVFISKSEYWTDMFEDVKVFTGFIRHLGYVKNQRADLSNCDPEQIPNVF